MRAKADVMRERQHAQQLREMTSFSINMARLTLHEWMRVGIRATVPEMEREIRDIQESEGLDREQAVARYADRLAGYVNGQNHS